MSTVKFDTWQNTDGTENYKCRAWCKFDGTSANITSTMTGGNVSSITDNGTGNYRVNFSTAITDGNYSAMVTTCRSNDAYGFNGTRDATQSTNYIDIGTSSTSVLSGGLYSDGPLDHEVVSVAIFR